jgi:hypothetical protein
MLKPLSRRFECFIETARVKKCLMISGFYSET